MQARCLDNFILNFSILINDWLLILAHSGYAIILLQPAIVGCSGALQKGDFSPNFCNRLWLNRMRCSSEVRFSIMQQSLHKRLKTNNALLCIRFRVFCWSRNMWHVNNTRTKKIQASIWDSFTILGCELGLC